MSTLKACSSVNLKPGTLKKAPLNRGPGKNFLLPHLERLKFAPPLEQLPAHFPALVANGPKGYPQLVLRPPGIGPSPNKSGAPITTGLDIGFW